MNPARRAARETERIWFLTTIDGRMRDTTSSRRWRLADSSTRSLGKASKSCTRRRFSGLLLRWWIRSKGRRGTLERGEVPFQKDQLLQSLRVDGAWDHIGLDQFFDPFLYGLVASSELFSEVRIYMHLSLNVVMPLIFFRTTPYT
jgi:hypothetical protein